MSACWRRPAITTINENSIGSPAVAAADPELAMARRGVEVGERGQIRSSGYVGGVPERDRVQVADSEPTRPWWRGVKYFRNLPAESYRPMCVFVIEVNRQISAAVRKTSPSTISLKRRGSRPAAAKPRERRRASAANRRRRCGRPRRAGADGAHPPLPARPCWRRAELPRWRLRVNAEFGSGRGGR